MKLVSKLISRYLVQAIVPYFAFSWLLLSVILFVQQASRYSDIFFSANIPAHLVWKLAVALIPNVVAFTCPMAVLVGTIIGLSRMQGDSELVAIRAAGVGNLQIALPIAILGILLSIFAFFVNLKGVPIAATLVRDVAMQSAIQKLESPIEPGVFNTEVAGYTIYVKGGDIATGHWRNIFIYSQDPASGNVRLITSQQGRLDTADQISELVLENATVSTIPAQPGTGKYVSENIGDVRLAIKTKRNELIEKLGSQQATPEELGLSDLAEYSREHEGADRTEAQILWQRRVILSISPLIFCLLGTAMILRFNRGGRGFGVFLALLGLIAYYLLAFLGEQLARTGHVAVLVGGLLPVGGSLLAIVWFSFSRRIEVLSSLGQRIEMYIAELRRSREKLPVRNIFVDLTTGLRDFDLSSDLFRYFALTLVFLAAMFIIFTAFELWKFAGIIDGGVWLLIKYLIFLLPYVYLQLAPSAAMVATLATYVIKSRQNEIVTWTSAGQSVYRLLVPCFAFVVLLGAFDWGVQEWVSPRSNQMQDELRTQIRKGGAVATSAGKYWVANDQRIYSFRLQPDTPASDNELQKASSTNSTQNSLILASDNDTQPAPCPSTCVYDLTVYEFAGGQAKLQTLYRSAMGQWDRDRITLTPPVEKSDVGEGKITTGILDNTVLDEPEDPFAELGDKPSHMTVGEIRHAIHTSDSEVETRNFAVALQKRYSTLFLPLVIALFTAPFALSLSRTGRVLTVGYAIGLWLVYTGITNLFEQFGLSGFLSPAFAIWSPQLLFAMLGVYLLTRVRT